MNAKCIPNNTQPFQDPSHINRVDALYHKKFIYGSSKILKSLIIAYKDFNICYNERLQNPSSDCEYIKLYIQLLSNINKINTFFMYFSEESLKEEQIYNIYHKELREIFWYWNTIQLFSDHNKVIILINVHLNLGDNLTIDNINENIQLLLEYIEKYMLIIVNYKTNIDRQIKLSKKTQTIMLPTETVNSDEPDAKIISFEKYQQKYLKYKQKYIQLKNINNKL